MLKNEVRRDFPPFVLSSQGHTAYAPFKLNLKTPVREYKFLKQ